jgi:hypothetical protein
MFALTNHWGGGGGGDEFEIEIEGTAWVVCSSAHIDDWLECACCICCEYAAFRLRSTGEARYEARYEAREARSEARGEATDDLSITFLLRLYIRGWPSVLGSCISSASIIK